VPGGDRNGSHARRRRTALGALFRGTLTLSCLELAELTWGGLRGLGFAAYRTGFLALWLHDLGNVAEGLVNVVRSRPPLGPSSTSPPRTTPGSEGHARTPTA